MQFYINELCLKPYKNHFKLSKEVAFWVDDTEYQMPKGMNTDLGSIPKPFRNLFDRFGMNTISYVVHDFGYRVQPNHTNRKYWDDLLLYLLRFYGMGKVKSYIIHKALRAFGSLAWNNNKKNRFIYE